MVVCEIMISQAKGAYGVVDVDGTASADRAKKRADGQNLIQVNSTSTCKLVQTCEILLQAALQRLISTHRTQHATLTRHTLWFLLFLDSTDLCIRMHSTNAHVRADMTHHLLSFPCTP